MKTWLALANFTGDVFLVRVRKGESGEMARRILAFHVHKDKQAMSEDYHPDKADYAIFELPSNLKAVNPVLPLKEVEG